jgi:hypothetical protein
MIINVVTDPAVGGTFLTWSLHYLSGHKTYYHARQEKFLDLTDNPLTTINAHNFKTNQVEVEEDFESIFTALKNTDTDTFHTLYLHNFKTTPFTTTSKCLLTTNAISQLQDTNDKIIVLYTSNKNNLYFSKFNSRTLHRKLNAFEKYESFEEQHSDFINTFFSASKKVWENMGMTNIWDHREFLALNLRPFEFCSVLPNVDLTKSHYKLDTFELYNHFDKTIIDLFDFLKLTLDKTRWDHWLSIYKTWQNIQTDRILFVEYFDCIIESIINNYYLDLKRFNLDIINEAVIQHELIYKYGLTIKGYGLEKFPDNTQDLHKLLQSNIYHRVEDIYNCLERK